MDVNQLKCRGQLFKFQGEMVSTGIRTISPYMEMFRTWKTLIIYGYDQNIDMEDIDHIWI